MGGVLEVGARGKAEPPGMQQLKPALADQPGKLSKLDTQPDHVRGERESTRRLELPGSCRRMWLSAGGPSEDGEKGTKFF